MIKLLACDVDGTLLAPDENFLSAGVMSALEKIKKDRKVLVVASGRSHFGLAKLLDSLKNDTYFVCCDGAVIIKNDKLLYHREISVNIAHKIVTDDIYKDCKVLVSTPFCSFVLGNDKEFAKRLSGLHTDKIEFAQSVFSIKEPICKIAIFNEKNQPLPLCSLPSGVRVAYNKTGWCEYVSAIANKGNAISDIQMREIVTKSETVCIGDGENDFEMMKKAKVAVSANNYAKVLDEVCTQHTDDVAGFLLGIE